MYLEALLPLRSERSTVPHQTSYVYLTTVYSYTCHCNRMVLSIWRKHPELCSTNKTIIFVLKPWIVSLLQPPSFCWGGEEEPRTKKSQTLVLCYLPAFLTSLTCTKELACVQVRRLRSVCGHPAGAHLLLYRWGCNGGDRPDTCKISVVAVCLSCCKWAQGGDRREDTSIVFQNSSEMPGLNFPT